VRRLDCATAEEDVTAPLNDALAVVDVDDARNCTGSIDRQFGHEATGPKLGAPPAPVPITTASTMPCSA
jgi:hypothetical protein